MSIFYPASDVDPVRIAAEAQRLADALDRFAAGAQPTVDDLASAPVIDLWQPAYRAVHVLTGVVARHPHVAHGRAAATSEIFAIDVDAGWARSWSRLYALGRPFALADRRRQ